MIQIIMLARRPSVIYELIYVENCSHDVAKAFLLAGKELYLMYTLVDFLFAFYKEEVLHAFNIKHACSLSNTPIEMQLHYTIYLCIT